MKKSNLSTGLLIIASAIIWGVTIIGSSSALNGTQCYSEIRNILIGGVVAHLILIWAPMVLLFKKKENNSA